MNGEERAAGVWFDSWHVSGSHMSSPAKRPERRWPPSPVRIRPATGRTGAGWKIVLDASAGFVLRMFNVLPGGEEALAVEALFTR